MKKNHYVRAIKNPSTDAPIKSKIARALSMVSESRPRMNKLSREARQKLEASARATIAKDKAAKNKSKPIKAKKMWSDESVVRFSEEPDMTRMEGTAGILFPMEKAVAVLDISDESVLIEQVAKVFFSVNHQHPSRWDEFHTSIKSECRQQARLVLESLGIIAKRKKGSSK